MYVIATVICPNFHFSVSPHVPFLNLLFEQIAIPASIYVIFATFTCPNVHFQSLTFFLPCPFFLNTIFEQGPYFNQYLVA